MRLLIIGQNNCRYCEKAKLVMNESEFSFAKKKYITLEEHEKEEAKRSTGMQTTPMIAFTFDNAKDKKMFRANKFGFGDSSALGDFHEYVRVKQKRENRRDRRGERRRRRRSGKLTKSF